MSRAGSKYSTKASDAVPSQGRASTRSVKGALASTGQKGTLPLKPFYKGEKVISTPHPSRSLSLGDSCGISSQLETLDTTTKGVVKAAKQAEKNIMAASKKSREVAPGDCTWAEMVRTSGTGAGKTIGSRAGGRVKKKGSRTTGFRG